MEAKKAVEARPKKVKKAAPTKIQMAEVMVLSVEEPRERVSMPKTTKKPMGTRGLKGRKMQAVPDQAEVDEQVVSKAPRKAKRK